MTISPDPIDTFIAHWQSAGGSERANYQLFITELCELLALTKPEPAQADARDNAFRRSATLSNQSWSGTALSSLAKAGQICLIAARSAAS